MDFQMYLSLFLTVISIAVILILMYFGSKWLTKKYTFVSVAKRIHIVDHAMLSKDKSIIVADIYGSKYIIGVSGPQLTLLKDLGEIEIKEEIDKQPQDFNAVLIESFQKLKKRVREIIFENGGKDGTEEN